MYASNRKKKSLEMSKTGMRVRDFNFPRKICRILNEAGEGLEGCTNPLNTLS